MGKKLLIWGCPLQHIASLKSKGIPTVSLGQLGISEEFNPKKTHPNFDFPWVAVYPNEPLLPMPENVVICLKKVKSVEFDFLEYGTMFYILSEPLLNYFKAHGLTIDYGMSRASIVNTKGEPLTEVPYYLIRHVNFEYKGGVQWHRDEDGQFYDATTDSDKDVLFLQLDEIMAARELHIGSCILVSAALKEEIEQHFKNPMLYTVEQWRELNKDMF